MKALNETVKEWLKKNGHDGLYSPSECACMRNDVMPYGADCTAGHKTPADQATGYDFMVDPKKDS
jgi:hypothetical protein